MSLESASYISQLVPTNPVGGDPKSSADDHLRLIKNVLQTQFSGLGAAAVTASAADLSKVGVTQAQSSNDTSPASTAFTKTWVASAIATQLSAIGAVTATSTTTFTNKSLALSGNTLTNTASGTGAVSVNLTSKFAETLNVQDFGAVGDGVTDDSAALQLALNAASGKTLSFMPGLTYKCLSGIIIKGSGTKILGRGATINSYATGNSVAFALNGGTTYPVNINIEDLSINAYGVGSYAVQLRTSYSTYRRLSIGIPAINVGGRGLVLPGDETYGSGPYYNTWIDCDIQSGSAGADHIGFSMTAISPGYRAGNANTWIGGRVGQCLINFVIKGNGNTFFNPASENSAATGTSFKFEADSPTNCTENSIHSAYIENAATAFVLTANTFNNYVFGCFATGVTTFQSDSGTANSLMTSNTTWYNPKGLKFGNIASTDANTLDHYTEGTWTPTPTNLTIVGTPTYTGRYVKIGKIVHWTLDVQSTTSTTSTANSTYFSGLPLAAAAVGIFSATDSNVASLGNGYVATSGQAYMPSWTTKARVYASGTYEATS